MKTIEFYCAIQSMKRQGHLAPILDDTYNFNVLWNKKETNASWIRTEKQKGSLVT